MTDLRTLLGTLDPQASLAARHVWLIELFAWLRGTPETIDASELFALVVPTRFDAQWMSALDEAQVMQLARLLSTESVIWARWRSHPRSFFVPR